MGRGHRPGTLTLKGHRATSIAWRSAPTASALASASGDETLKVWDADTGQEVLTLKGHTGHVNSVAFSPDGKRLASASWDETVKVVGRGHRPGGPHAQGSHRRRV